MYYNTHPEKNHPKVNNFRKKNFKIFSSGNKRFSEQITLCPYSFEKFYIVI